MVRNVYGVAGSTISKIVQFFRKLVRLHLQGTFAQFPSPVWFRVLAEELEALHEMPRIIEAIDGYHILILAHVIGGEDY